MVKVKKAVIVAAGLGTRFLPASKSVPKVMFPVVDKPILQIIVDEIVKAGIKDISIVVSPFSYSIIKDYFKFNSYLNSVLRKGKKTELLEILKNNENMAKFSFVVQKPGRIGTGTAILSAQRKIGNEPFLLMFADDFFVAKPGFVVQLVNNYKDKDSCLLGCMRTKDPKHGERFGFVTGNKTGGRLYKVNSLIEKPGYGKAPSELASMVGMIFPSSIFRVLKKADKELAQNKELYHTEGIKKLISENENVYALEYKNYEYFDTGDKLGYIKAQVKIGMKDKNVGKDLRIFIKDLNKVN